MAALSNALRLAPTDYPKNLQTPPTLPYNPAWTTAAACHAHAVWAHPLSLAATQGITVVSFSSGYLDVSVPRVSLDKPIDSAYR